MEEVTFRDSRVLMEKRKRTVDDLVDLFHGKLDENRGFFERVMSCQWRNSATGRGEDRSDTVIPYRSVLEYYFKEKAHLADSQQEKEKAAAERKPQLSEERRDAMRKQMQAINARRKSVSSQKQGFWS